MHPVTHIHPLILSSLDLRPTNAGYDSSAAVQLTFTLAYVLVEVLLEVECDLNRDCAVSALPALELI